jgi:hypothetical protein
MADEGDALDLMDIDRLMGAWLESVEYAPERFLPGEMPDVDDAELMEKGDRSAAGRKAALARWGNRGPVNDSVRAKRSDAARRAAATRRAKKEEAAAAGPETDEQAAARMGAEFRAKRDTGEPIDAIGEIAKRDDYERFIKNNADALGLRTGGSRFNTLDDEGRIRDEVGVLTDAVHRIRAIEEHHATSNTNMTGHVAQRYQENATDFSNGDLMTATPPDVALRILGGERCKSQFDTGDSRGLFDPFVRATQETTMLRVHPGISPSQRPTYGYISVGAPTSRGPGQYGTVRFQLKEEVTGRATFTIGDSLGSTATPLPMRSRPSIREAVRAEGWTSTGGQDDIARIQTYSYGEAQISGGWGVSDVAKVYVPSGSDAIVAAAKAAGIPVEVYN